MNILMLFPLLFYAASALLLLLCKRESEGSGKIALAGSLAAAVAGMFPAVAVLSGHGPIDLFHSWTLPFGAFHLHMDRLSAWFSIPVLLVSLLAAWYGMGYMSHYRKEYSVKFNWFFFQMLSGGMYFVLVAWDGFLFLIAWEIMSFAAWFLVMFDHKRGEVRRAGWVYLAATHLGTAFLFAMFIICRNGAGSFDFSEIAGLSVSLNAVFILAVIGFGSKAGLMGLHVWLPEAHPAAPSHVSGLMSGVMIKAGIYGIIRMAMLVDGLHSWWGWLLIGLGICSGLGGVVYAVIQKDLKQLLAYSSVENIGIITMGLGLGLLGLSRENPLGTVALAGALLHVLNHSVFKTALFMSAGSVAHGTGTRNIDVMGGLGRKMPVTAAVFLVGSLAICGLPPFNGFVSEFLIYMTSYKSIFSAGAGNRELMLAGLAVISTLALVGGLAVYGFTKVFGIVFLGSPRSDSCKTCEESPGSMIRPMALLAFVSGLLGFGGSLAVKAVFPVAGSLFPVVGSVPEASTFSSLMVTVSLVMTGLMLLSLCLWILRSRLLNKRTVAVGPTWDCGYEGGTSRMQYTGSSYTEPLLYAFRTLFHSKTKAPDGTSLLPEENRFSTETPDLFMRYFYTPLFSRIASLFSRLRIIQHGRLNLYILYIILALTGIIIWSTI